MRKLVVLCERDERELLKYNGINVSLVSTDIDMFVSKMPYFEGIDIAIILSGVGRFSIPKIVDLVDKTRTSGIISNDSILSIKIISNVKIEMLSEYYRFYDCNIRRCFKVIKGKELRKDINPFEAYIFNSSNEYVKPEYIDGIDEEFNKSVKFLRGVSLSKEYEKMNEIIFKSR